MNFVADESDGAATVFDGIEFSILSGRVVDERTVVHDHVGVFRHQNQNAGTRVNGAVGYKTTAVNGGTVERADERHCPLVADEMAAINEQVRRAGHISSTDHGRLHPQSCLVQIYDTLFPRWVNLFHHIVSVNVSNEFINRLTSIYS